MTFNDEFKTLNLAHYSTLFFWGNRWLKPPVGELQVYVDPSYFGTSKHQLRLNPFSIVDGVLHIQAAIPAPTVQPYLEGQHYTSGLLSTYKTFSQLYGYFEIRAKLPRGKGFHPTFWLLQNTLQPQPPSEIDICETTGDHLTTLYATAHWDDLRNRARSKGEQIAVPDLSADFHRYGVLWTKSWLAWYFDGARVAYQPTPERMHKPMHMLLNLAVGGEWAGPPDEMTQFPGDFEVDYIRVYALGR